MSSCFDCKYCDSRPYGLVCMGQKNAPQIYRPEKACACWKSGKHTNADRIRAMTDKALAKYLYVKTCEDCYPQFDNIPEWLNWMKQEARD